MESYDNEILILIEWTKLIGIINKKMLYGIFEIS